MCAVSGVAEREGWKVVIQRAGTDDLAWVRGLAERSQDAPHWPQAAWAKFAGSDGPEGEPRSVLLVARERAGEVVGWLAANAVFETAELEYVLVAEPYRQAGFGRQLVERWMEWARAQGATQALLEVRSSNEAARRLYAQLGFSARGRRAAYYREPVEDALVLGRVL